MSNRNRDSYASAGVDYSVLDRVKQLAQGQARGTSGRLAMTGAREVEASRGETAYVVDMGDHYLATVLECLGTKSLVADAMRPHLGRSSYERIARDAVAAIVNDLAAVGAQPLVVNAYFAVGSAAWFADEERAADLIQGWAEACRETGAAWGGGESPSLRGIVESDAIDLAGSAVGVVQPKERLVTAEKLRPGDAIVLVASSGIHANGLSLVRRTAAELPQGYLSPLADGRPLGDALLDASPLYSNLVREVQEAGVDVHYLIHITGHGWRKLMRAERNLTYVIDRLPEVPPVLAFLAEAARLSDEEAYGTFNMGAGFAFYVVPEQAPAVVDVAHHQGVSALIAGRVEEGSRRVIIQPKGIEYHEDSLRIR